MKKITLTILSAIVFCTSASTATDFSLGVINNNSSKNLAETKDKRSEIAKQFNFIPMWEWKKGMKFIPQEDEYDIGFDIPLKPYKSESYYAKNLKNSDYSGKIFEVDRVEERHVSCPRGDCIRTYVVFSVEGEDQLYEYEFTGSKSEMKNASSDAFQQISNLQYIGDILKARKLLIGKTFYIMTRMWRGDSASRNDCRKYIPVKVLNIGFSNDDFNDTSIAFETSDGVKAYVDVTLGGTNIPSDYKDSDVSNSFDELFSLDDPRRKYKGRAEMWDAITRGVVKIGMTEDEVVWSWGSPEKINESYPGPDQWVYDSKCLYFEGGKLTAFN
ncbi:MAG TPA: hypothetical protein VKM37_00230 [Balneolaceae bacterium]|nr:hypothetical protein [Balneolaceae bacterium]